MGHPDLRIRYSVPSELLRRFGPDPERGSWPEGGRKATNVEIFIDLPQKYTIIAPRPRRRGRLRHQLPLFEVLYDLRYTVVGCQSLFDGRATCWEFVGYRYFLPTRHP